MANEYYGRDPQFFERELRRRLESGEPIQDIYASFFQQYADRVNDDDEVARIDKLFRAASTTPEGDVRP